MNFPSTFTQNIKSSFGDQGREWLSRLPALIEDASRRWGLTDVQPVPNLSYNFVAFTEIKPAGRVAAGSRYVPPELLDHRRRIETSRGVVLKIGVPHKELNSEIHALKLFNGDGACQLIECDEEKGFMLIERLRPGTMLADLEDDDERTHIAIDVMRNLILGRGEVTSPLRDAFIKLSDWFDGLKEIRPMFNGETGPIPENLLEQVEASLPDLFADGDVRLMHGDFHHYNILSSERGWLAIDPKGVIGPASYEIGPLMLNPWIKPMDWNQFKVQTERRIDIIRERTGWAREKIVGWSLAHAILSAYWDLELDPDYPIEAARVFSTLK